MNDYETLSASALGLPARPDETAVDAVPAAPLTRRSLRDAERRAASSEIVQPDAPVHPVQYASRRAAREAAVVEVPQAVIAAPAAPAFAWEQPLIATPVREAADVAPAIVPIASRASLRSRMRLSSVPRPSRQRVTAAGTMVLVGGLFVSLALPAYASNDFESNGYAAVASESSAAKAAIGAQALAVDAVSAADAGIEARDTYDAVSPAQLRTMFRDGLRQQNLTAYMSSGARELGDDYPWPAELTRPQGGGLSPLNYYYRECVDFVAWRLNRDAGSVKAPFVYNWSTLTPGAGSARSWKKQWEKHGWEISTTPSAGWVAWFPGANHVSYVNSVLPDGSVLIEEYNWGPHLYGQRIIPASDAIYLAPPPR